MPDNLRMLFEDQRTRADALRKMPGVNAFGLVSLPGDQLMSRLDPALVLQPVVAPAPQSTEMQSEWAPVLKRISDLGEQGLHTTMLLSDFIWRRFAPLRENPKRFWAYSGPSDILKVSNNKPMGQQVQDFLRGCILQRSNDRIRMPDNLRILFEDHRTRADIL